MLRYTCNTLNGDFNITRAAAALGLTNAATETLLEIFEDAGMIKINGFKEDIFTIHFVNTVELSKAVQNVKYKDFTEQLKSINEYKNSFMTKEI